MSTETLRADVVVVGLGAMGVATLYQLARRGVDAVGIDRRRPPHDLGSSHGETRITRVAVGEGAEYVPLARRSHEIWRDLERETGQELLRQVGCLLIRTPGEQAMHHGSRNFLGRTLEIARQLRLPHETLTAQEISRRFPVFDVRGDEEAFFDPQGGYVHPERCMAAQLDRAEALGARVLADGPALEVVQRGGVVSVQTEARRIEAPQAVVSAGPWAGAVLGPPFDRLAVPHRQVLHWFDMGAAAGAAEAAPSFIWMHGPSQEDQFYGFPPLPGSAEMKIATEQYASSCDPDRVARGVSAAEQEQMSADHVAGRIRGASARPSRSSVCFYTVTPDFGFVIDRHPAMDRVLAVSPCSGHGFKHSAAIGEAVAETLAEGRSRIDLSAFALSRFG